MDEINQVRAGFNSGWQDVMGPSSRQSGFSTAGLVKLGQQAHYSEPELSWEKPVAPTDLHFYEGARLGESYRNDLFAGDVNTGSLYHFRPHDATQVAATHRPAHRLPRQQHGNLLDEQASIRFGQGFGVTTDILSGPGGFVRPVAEPGEALPDLAEDDARKRHDGDERGVRTTGCRCPMRRRIPAPQTVFTAVCLGRGSSRDARDVNSHRERCTDARGKNARGQSDFCQPSPGS
jgi:hypothetical protein